MYDYNLWQWLLIFYLYCICGWIFETIVVSAQQKHFVNRGFLKGPMLPIYGFGATIMLHVSLPLMGHPIAIYFAGMITATAFEYAVGLLMESLFKVKYWDYSEHRFQFQGRICLQSSVAWGFLSIFLAYVLHQPLAGLITDLGMQATVLLSLAISVWFVYDVVTSTKAAFELATALEELEKLRAEAEELRVQLQLGVYEAQDRLDDAREEFRERMEAAQDEFRERIESAQNTQRERRQAAAEERKAQLREALAEIEERMGERMRRKNRQYRALLRANPTIRSQRFSGAMHEWKERLKEKE